jgi:hypothetical protein
MHTHYLSDILCIWCTPLMWMKLADGISYIYIEAVLTYRMLVYITLSLYKDHTGHTHCMQQVFLSGKVPTLFHHQAYNHVSFSLKIMICLKCIFIKTK